MKSLRYTSSNGSHGVCKISDLNSTLFSDFPTGNKNSRMLLSHATVLTCKVGLGVSAAPNGNCVDHKIRRRLIPGSTFIRDFMVM